MPEGPKRLLDYVDAACYLGVSERHVRHLWETHRVAAVKIGNRVRFTVTDLDAFIESRRVAAVGQ